MFCKKCGKQLKDGAQFCAYCGEKVVMPELSAPVKRPEAQSLSESVRMPATVKQGKKKVWKRILLIAVIIIVVIALAALGYFAWSKYMDGAIEDYEEEETVKRSIEEEPEEEAPPVAEEPKEEASSAETSEKSDEEEDMDEEEEAKEEEAEEEVSQFFLPTSDSEYLTISDLEGFSQDDCRLARNELYARHGRRFDDPNLQAYFDAFDWYEGTIAPADFDDSVMNEYEIANRDLIVQYEKKMGYR